MSATGFATHSAALVGTVLIAVYFWLTECNRLPLKYLSNLICQGSTPVTINIADFAPQDYWDRFRQTVRGFAPQMPEVESTRVARVTGVANDGVTLVGAAAAGAGAEIPGLSTLGSGLSIGAPLVQGDAGGAASAVGDDLIGRALGFLGVEAGAFVSGFLMLAHGASQSLTRTDDMTEYLNTMSGYVATLSRISAASLRERAPYTQLPMPIVPPYIERTGDLYSDRARTHFTNGYQRAVSVVREMDAVRRPTGDSPSKICFCYVALNTGMTGQSESDSPEIRRRSERYILQSILQIDLRGQAEVMRRWANAH